MIIVPPAGRTPNPVLLVGEAPGRYEAEAGRPFVGPSGRLQEEMLGRHGLTALHWRRTNVVQEYREGNPDPTAAQIRHWTPVLEQEIATCAPQLIVAVGRFAAQWFLGPCTMELVHGLPHRAGAFDSRLASRAPASTTILPIYHPAAALHADGGDLLSFVWWDYKQVATTLAALERGREVPSRRDEHEGRESYHDVSGRDLALALGNPDVLAIDTEGSSTDPYTAVPWSIQVSCHPGTAFVLRRSQPDFHEGIAALQRAADRGCRVVVHHGMYDLGVCRRMGLDLRGANLWDSMYALYLLRLEPQALKLAAWRWCGMRMEEYSEVVGDAAREAQLQYLERCLDVSWPPPEREVEIKNDGTTKLTRPKPIPQRALQILTDWYTKKRDKHGNLPDLDKRWKQLSRSMRRTIQRTLGPWPVATLADVPLPAAVRYSARDADATLRLFHALDPVLTSMDLQRTMREGMAAEPIFEQMQASGMLASRSKLQAMVDHVDHQMQVLVRSISKRFYGGAPFNPASGDQAAAVLRRRGLEALQLTTTGKMSTSKKSIEYLRFEDEYVRALFEWREMAKVRDAFGRPLLERALDLDDAAELAGRMDEVGADLFAVRCDLGTTRVATRRLSAKDPNLLQMPTRTALGRRVRDCYVAPPGHVYAAWDLSQIEVRVAAHLSQDPVMCRVLREGRDIHTETAMRIFGLPEEQLDKMLHRYPAKRATFGCVPLDSLALTPEGWKSHAAVGVGDTVMGYNAEAEALEWTTVLEKMVYPSAPLVRLSNHVWSAVSTPNHRWYGRRRVGLRNRRYEPCVVETEKVNTETILTLAAQFAAPAQLPIAVEEAATIGWVLGDGWIRRAPLTGRTAQGLDGRRRAINVGICQSKPEGVDEIRRILRGRPHTEQLHPSREAEGYRVFRLRSDYARDLFARARFFDVPLDRWVLMLSSEQREAFVDAVWRAEGSKDRHGHRVLRQNEGEVLEAIRLAVFLCGYRPSRNVNDRRGRRTSYTVRFRRPEITGQRLHKDPVPAAPVWCVRTALGTWVMKQGDEMMITGNSLYGISASGLLTQLRMMGCEGWDEDRCAELLESWWGVYEGVGRCVQATAEQVRRDGFVRDEGGMYRFLPGIWSRDRGVRAAAEREAFSHRVQGMAQTMIQRSMAWIGEQLLPLQRTGWDVRWRLQVHDELIVSFPEWMWEVVDPIVVEGLTAHHGVEMTVPVGSEGCSAESWGALK